MKTIPRSIPPRSGSPAELLQRMIVLAASMLLIAGPKFMYGQAAESANAGRAYLWAGAGVSGYYEQYGARKLLGVTGFVDADTIRHFGVEAEGQWLDFHQVANVNVQTYMAGPRYHFDKGKFQPYAKGLVGMGEFNFPYNYAHGSYLVIAPGIGVDYRLNRRWGVRAIDFKYQYWPQFTFGAMSSVGITTGIRYRIF